MYKIFHKLTDSEESLIKEKYGKLLQAIKSRLPKNRFSLYSSTSISSLAKGIYEEIEKEKTKSNIINAYMRTLNNKVAKDNNKQKNQTVERSVCVQPESEERKNFVTKQELEQALKNETKRLGEVRMNDEQKEMQKKRITELEDQIFNINTKNE